MDREELIEALQGFDNESPIFIQTATGKVYIVSGAAEDQEGGIELLIKEQSE